MPLSLHAENSLYNMNMAKYKTKPKHRGIINIVRPEKVIKKLSELGLVTTQRTLQQYAKDGLIEKPDTKSAGRGKGKIADWPKDTPEQFFASWWLRNSLKIKPDRIIAGKKLRAQVIKNNPGGYDESHEEWDDFQIDGFAESREEWEILQIGVTWSITYKKAKNNLTE